MQISSRMNVISPKYTSFFLRKKTGCSVHVTTNHPWVSWRGDQSSRQESLRSPSKLSTAQFPRSSAPCFPLLLSLSPFFCFPTVDKQCWSCRTAHIPTMWPALVHGAPPGDLDHCSPCAAAEHSRTGSMGRYVDAWSMPIQRPGCSESIGKYNDPERQDLSSCR